MYGIYLMAGAPIFSCNVLDIKMGLLKSLHSIFILIKKNSIKIY